MMARPLWPGAQGGAAASLLWLAGQWLHGPHGQPLAPADAGLFESTAAACSCPAVLDLDEESVTRAFLLGVAVGVALGPLVDTVLLCRRLWARCLLRLERRLSGDLRVPLRDSSHGLR